MKFTVKNIAEMLDGELEGNAEALVWKLGKIEEGEDGCLTFLANPKYEQYIYNTKATAVVVSKSFVPTDKISAILIKVDDAYSSFAKLLEIYNQVKLNKIGISKQACISSSSRIGEECYIGEFTSIGENVVIGNKVKIYPGTYIGDNVKINDNTRIFAGVKIYSDCEIGSNCTIHSGVVIGADGFGYAPQQDGTYKKIVQTGNVVIEDNVEIGANSTIDRATLGSTIIRKGVKIDNLVMLAHNVEIGEDTVIVAQTGISGSTKVGKNCVIGGQVGMVGHITIADGVKIQAQSGINRSLTIQGEAVQGSPAYSIKEYLKSYIHFKNLGKLNLRVEELEKRIKDI